LQQLCTQGAPARPGFITEPPAKLKPDLPLPQHNTHPFIWLLLIFADDFCYLWLLFLFDASICCWFM